MKILLLHLSDIHLKEKDFDAQKEYFLKVAHAVAAEPHEIKNILLLVSGDVANSGQTAEYEVASKLFEVLTEELESRIPDVKVHQFTVPGNHDCNFSQPNAARDMILSSIRSMASPTIDNTVVENCCSPQEEFFAYLKKTGTNPESLLYWEHRLEVDGKTICIRCVNTAWMSTRNETQGSLCVCTESIKKFINQDGTDFCACMLHHPYPWLNGKTNNHHRVRELLEPISDILLTGHEHEGRFMQSTDFKIATKTTVEGRLFKGRAESEGSGFNAIWIDLDHQKEKLVYFSYLNGIYQKESETGWESYTNGPRGKQRFLLAEHTQEWCSEPGTSFSHPTKSRLTLDDIFVPPNVRPLSYAKGARVTKKAAMNAASLIETMGIRKRLFLYGAEQSGKTTLAKVIFTKSYEADLIPVYLEGADFSKGSGRHTLESIKLIVDGAFSKQYANAMLPLFQQMEQDKIVIILDSFEKTKLSPKGRLHLLELLLKTYDRVIVFANETLKFEDFALGELGDELLTKFEHYDLLEFGHALRGKLIERWYSLGVEFITDTQTRLERSQKAEGLINSLLGKSYLPAFPVFVLTFLQAIDSSLPVQSSAGTYGGLYEILISQQLAHAPTKSLTYDTRRTYLSWIAHWMFSKREQSLAVDGWRLCHVKYCEYFSLSYSEKQIAEDLLKTGVIVFQDDHYTFKHPYAYFYFVAKYLSDNIHDEQVKTTIKSLCEKLHREEHASIWLFLTHLSKAPFIIETIAEHAKKQFSEVKEIEFNNDVAFVTSLYSSIPRIVLMDRDFEEQRKERLESLDAHTSREKELKEPEEGTDEISKIISRLNSALKTLEILGQLVKNFPGSLKGTDKEQIVAETYSLGLRTLGWILDTVKQNGEGFVKDCVKHIKQLHPHLAEDKIESEVRKLIFLLVELTSLGWIKKISYSIGHPDLEKTYEELAAKGNVNNARKLIEIAVRLDSLDFPEALISEYAKEFASNIFSMNVLRRLVVNHFYIFPKPFTFKQRICSKLGIPVEKIQALETLGAGEKRVPRKPGKANPSSK